MEVSFTAKRVNRNVGFSEYCLEIITDKEYAKSIESVLSQGKKEWQITIGTKKKPRTTQANAFLWALCTDIAKAMWSTKEEVYQRIVEKVGVYDFIVTKACAGDRFATGWAQKGIGWFTVEIDCNIENARQFMAYYGTSAYTTEEMARVIDEAVHEAEELNLPIAHDELQELRESWA